MLISCPQRFLIGPEIINFIRGRVTTQGHATNMLGVAILLLCLAVRDGVRVPGSARYVHTHPERQMSSVQGRMRVVMIPGDESEVYAESIRYKRESSTPSPSDEIITVS
jgi:hypothetical protein